MSCYTPHLMPCEDSTMQGQSVIESRLEHLRAEQDLGGAVCSDVDVDRPGDSQVPSLELPGFHTRGARSMSTDLENANN